MLITFDKDDPVRPKAPEKAAQTLLQSVFVIDVFPPLRAGEPGVLVLALNPMEAQFAALAMDENKIHIALRGDQDAEFHPMQGTGFRKLFR